MFPLFGGVGKQVADGSLKTHALRGTRPYMGVAALPGEQPTQGTLLGLSPSTIVY